MQSIPRQLPPGLESYARSPDFTPETLPAKLRSAHALKAGTWGLLQIAAGKLRYTLEPPNDGEIVASKGDCIVIESEVPHRVAFLEPGEFHIEFFREARATTSGTNKS